MKKKKKDEEEEQQPTIHILKFSLPDEIKWLVGMFSEK